MLHPRHLTLTLSALLGALFFCTAAFAQSAPTPITISGHVNSLAPNSNNGAEGNWFYDVDSGNVWGPKTSGFWPSIPAFTGPTTAITNLGVHADGIIEPVNVSCTSTSTSITLTPNIGYPYPPYPSLITAADIGKSIVLPGCGGHSIGTGIPSITGAGSGYVFGEIITVAGGTANLTHPLRIIVLATNGTNLTAAGGITAVALFDGGDYSTFPSGTISQASTTKSGTGATFTLPAPYTSITATITAVSATNAPNAPQTFIISTPATVTQTGALQRVLYGTDQTTAINSAITTYESSHPNPGGALNFPTPPAANCYAITGQVQLPMTAAWPLNNQLTISGDGPASQICELTPSAEIAVGGATTFSRGARITRLTIDGGNIATHNLEILNGSQTTLDHSWLVNAAPSSSNLRLVTGGENTITENFFNNDYTFVPSLVDFPAFIIDAESADNHFTNNVFFDSQTAQVYDNAADNHYLSNHAYGFPAGYIAPYNFIANAASNFTNNTADTATIAGFLIAGYGVQLVANHAQSGISSTPVGFELYSGVQNVLVESNWSDLTTVTTAVQMLGTTAGGSPLAGTNTVIGFNTGSTASKDIFSFLGPLVSGYPLGNNSHHGASILGYLGNYGSVQGAGTFALGDSANDQFTTCRFYRAGGNNGFSGDSQVSDVVFRGSSTTTANLVSCNPGGHSQTNQIRLRTDIKASESIDIKLNAFCSTGDFLYATLSTGLQQTTQTAAGVLFQTSSTTSATPPAFAVTRITAGATTGSWTPAIVLDNTNGGAFLTMTGTCTGSKTIYTTADVHIVETGAGSN